MATIKTAVSVSWWLLSNDLKSCFKRSLDKYVVDRSELAILIVTFLPSLINFCLCSL